MKPLILSLTQIVLLSGICSNSVPVMAQSNPEPAAVPNAIAPNPDSFDQQFQVARKLAISGQREEALRAYSALLQRSPGNADVLIGRGRVYAWMDQWSAAEADVSAATISSPNYGDAWSALGDLYLWSDRPALAAEAYGRWLALAAKDDPEPLIARGRAYRAAGNFLAARADFQAAADRGAAPTEVQGYLLSLKPRVENPEAAVPAGYLWSASLSSDWTTFSPARSDWSAYTLSVRRHFEQGSLALEVLDAQRFGTNDQAFALDGYLDLWQRAYINLRYQNGPKSTLFPRNSGRVELFQGVGHGWELSSSYDRLQFDSSNVDIYGLGVGKYIGNWYLRARGLYIPDKGGDGTTELLLARYYYAGDGDNYVEMTGGLGQGSQAIPGLPGSFASTNSSSASLSWVHYFEPNWGFKIGTNYSGESNGFTGLGVFGALYTRW